MATPEFILRSSSCIFLVPHTIFSDISFLSVTWWGFTFVLRYRMLSREVPVLEDVLARLSLETGFLFQVRKSSKVWFSFSIQSDLSSRVSAENQHLHNKRSFTYNLYSKLYYITGLNAKMRSSFEQPPFLDEELLVLCDYLFWSSTNMTTTIINVIIWNRGAWHFSFVEVV